MKVGLAGAKIRFLKDKWLGENNLKYTFRRLFSISTNQGRILGEVGRWTNIE